MTSLITDILQLPTSTPDLPVVTASDPATTEAGFAGALQILLGAVPSAKVAVPLSLEGIADEGTPITVTTLDSPDTAQNIPQEPLITTASAIPEPIVETQIAVPAVKEPVAEASQPIPDTKTASPVTPEPVTNPNAIATVAVEVESESNTEFEVSKGRQEESSEILSEVPSQDSEPVTPTRTAKPVVPLKAIETDPAQSSKPAPIHNTVAVESGSTQSTVSTKSTQPNDATNPVNYRPAQSRPESLNSERNVEAALHEAIKPFKNESIKVQVTARTVSNAQTQVARTTELKPSQNPVPTTAALSLDQKPDTHAFARAFFQVKPTSPATPIVENSAVSVAAPKSKLIPRPGIEIVSVPEGQTESTGDVESITPKPTRTEFEATPKTEKPEPKQATLPPKSDLPAPAETTETKAELRVSGTDHTATRTEVALFQPATDKTATTESTPVVRYEIERPRDLQVPGQIRVRIDPPELGNVRVELTSSRDGIVGTLRFESEHAREIVGRDLSNLHRSLTDAGIRVERLDVVGAANTDSRTAFQQHAPDQQQSFPSFSRGSSQGNSQGGRYTPQNAYSQQQNTNTNPWAADPRETVWQAPSGLLMQVNLVA